MDAATSAIRYPLRGHHLAVVLWFTEASPAADELTRLQAFLADLGQATGAGPDRLFVPANQTLGWGWLSFRAPAPDIVEEVRRLALSAADSPSIAIGTIDAGLDGFRRSHRQAARAHSVAVAGSQPGAIALAATDPGLSAAALLAGDLDAARDWVVEVLGDLAGDDENDARLRETLHVFLCNGDSYKLTAQKLHLHVNTVKYRIMRAHARRGRAVGADRLDVELALLVCHWYGNAVALPEPSRSV